jgi:hypothetical protein
MLQCKAVSSSLGAIVLSIGPEFRGLLTIGEDLEMLEPFHRECTHLVHEAVEHDVPTSMSYYVSGEGAV